MNKVSENAAKEIRKGWFVSRFEPIPKPENSEFEEHIIESNSSPIMKRPRCKCGKPAEFYGPVGGYSKACVDCNKANAKRQRIAPRGDSIIRSRAKAR